MTIEEAINTINSLKQYYNDKNQDSYVGFDNEDNEALDMAIEALKRFGEGYAKGYNDAKREIALSGEYERCYKGGYKDGIKYAIEHTELKEGAYDK